MEAGLPDPAIGSERATARDRSNRPGTPSTRFAGRVAIVTGAARGIGAATAARLAADGARVLLADLLPEVAATSAAIGGTALAIDLTERGAGDGSLRPRSRPSAASTSW